MVLINDKRSTSAIQDVLRHLDLSYPTSTLNGMRVVTYNGAKVTEVTNTHRQLCSNQDQDRPTDGTTLPVVTMQEKVLFHEPVPIDATKKVLNIAKKLGLATNYYVGDHIYVQSLTVKHQKAIERYGRLTGVTFTYCTDDYVAAMEEGLPSKLLVLCSENVDTLYDRLKEELDSSNESKEGGKQMAAVINGTPAFFVEILKNDVCKGYGVLKMCESLGIDMSECISFGDGYNDLEMLQMSGLGYAMKNAHAAIQDCADEVTEWTNSEDGVIRTLQKLDAAGLLQYSA